MWGLFYLAPVFSQVLRSGSVSLPISSGTSSLSFLVLFSFFYFFEMNEVFLPIFFPLLEFVCFFLFCAYLIVHVLFFFACPVFRSLVQMFLSSFRSSLSVVVFFQEHSNLGLAPLNSPEDFFSNWPKIMAKSGLMHLDLVKLQSWDIEVADFSFQGANERLFYKFL